MPTSDAADLTAAELALGVLEGEERAAALRRVLADPGFAAEVERWRDQLAVLHGEWPEVDPGSAARRRAASIPDGGSKKGRSASWIAAWSAIAAAFLLTVTLVRRTPTPQPAPVTIGSVPTLAAVVTPKDGDPFSVLFDPTLREIRLGGLVNVPPDRDAELWVIGNDGIPRAAGLVTRPASRHLRLAQGLAVVAGTTLAISIEPTGGSPKTTPTGPVIATGKLLPI